MRVNNKIKELKEKKKLGDMDKDSIKKQHDKGKLTDLSKPLVLIMVFRIKRNQEME